MSSWSNFRFLEVVTRSSRVGTLHEQHLHLCVVHLCTYKLNFVAPSSECLRIYLSYKRSRTPETHIERLLFGFARPTPPPMAMFYPKLAPGGGEASASAPAPGAAPSGQTTYSPTNKLGSKPVVMTCLNCQHHGHTKVESNNCTAVNWIGKLALALPLRCLDFTSRHLNVTSY